MRIEHAARYDVGADAVVIQALTVTDRGVVQEAQRWTTGRRGPAIDDPAELGQADLSTFATEAIVIGARALAATAQTIEARAVEQMLRDVGERTADAASKAAELTGRAVRDASETVVRVATDATKAITEADQKSRRELCSAVEAARREMATEIQRLFGGDSPELLDRLQPLLSRFGTSLEAQVRTTTGELLDRTARQLDPADPTSPMARHAAALAAQQETVARQIATSHSDLAAKVDELTTMLRIREARAAVARVTPIKGASFEAQIHKLVEDIAAGLGDDYADTTTKTGLLPRSRKGDGVLSVEGGSTRIVLEVTDSIRTGWGDYLDEAERNRAASGALGVVRTPEQNGGRTVRVLGPRRIILSFDPDQDDPELLRTVLLLLRTVAIAATTRTGAGEIATAEEKITEAITRLEKVDAVKKLADGIQKNAAKIDSECAGITMGIHRLLDEALIALAQTGGAMAAGEAGDVEPGAA